MPYPTREDPDFCPGSHTPVELGVEVSATWVRCPACGRIIAGMSNGLFFPHVNNPARARNGDSTREILAAAGVPRFSFRPPV